MGPYTRMLSNSRLCEAVEREIIANRYELQIKPNLRQPGLVCGLRLMFIPIIERSIPLKAVNELGEAHYMTDQLGNPLWRFKFSRGKYYNYGPVIPPEY